MFNKKVWYIWLSFLCIIFFSTEAFVKFYYCNTVPCCLWFTNGTQPWVSHVSDTYIFSRKWESCVKFTVHVKSCTSVSRHGLTRARCTGRVPQPWVARVVLAQTRRAQRGSEPTHRVIKGEWPVGIEPSTLRDWFKGHFARSATCLLPFRTVCCRICVRI